MPLLFWLTEYALSIALEEHRNFEEIGMVGEPIVLLTQILYLERTATLLPLQV